MHNFFSIKFAYEKYISHRNKQSFQKKINIVTPDKSPLSTISVGILKFFKTINSKALAGRCLEERIKIQQKLFKNSRQSHLGIDKNN